MLQACILVGLAFFFLACLTAPALASSSTEHHGALRSKVDLATLRGQLQTAIGEAMGCGGHISQGQLSGIEKVLAPTWRSLPKNAAGRTDYQSLRYLAHRYFSGQFSIRVRGFEPTRPAQMSSPANNDILSMLVPQYVDSALDSHHARERGFSLHDAVQVVATIEQLMFDSESILLEKAYQTLGQPTTDSLSALRLQTVLQDYLVHWLMGNDDTITRELLVDRALLENSIPHWSQICALAGGQVKALQFSRQRRPVLAGQPAQNALSYKFSFEDAHQVVGYVTRSFHSFWSSECTSLKEVLVAMDKRRTGRVPLSRFYADGLANEWRFGESEEYLRELGALDETSGWRGKQVIIANYLQAASNCIVSTPHYRVCCESECDALLGEIEVAVGRPTASPEELLRIVSNVTSQTTLDHDDPPRIEDSLVKQLEQIAAASNGSIPLHGRLLAQWLHYVFPHECPFPHKAGTATAATPLEFGNASFAREEDMRRSAANSSNTTQHMMGREDPQWMSQWSFEEEFMVGPITELHAPWDTEHVAIHGAAAVVFIGILVFASRRPKDKGCSQLPMHI